MKVTGQQPPRTSDLTLGKTREANKQLERKDAAEIRPQAPAQGKTSLAMRKIRDVIDKTPDVRSERVAAIKERIKNGTFKVDTERLASAILNESVREDLEKP